MPETKENVKVSNDDSANGEAHSAEEASVLKNSKKKTSFTGCSTVFFFN